MKTSLKHLIPLTLLLATCICYTLDGQWDLTNNHLTYTTSNPNVRLNFHKTITTAATLPVQDRLGTGSTSVTHTGTNKVTVHACRTLTYNYYVRENQVYLQKVLASA